MGSPLHKYACHHHALVYQSSAVGPSSCIRMSASDKQGDLSKQTSAPVIDYWPHHLRLDPSALLLTIRAH